MNISSKIRQLTAAGYTADQIADRLDIHPWRVSQALARSTRIGRPGGQVTLEDQISFARRIAESTKHEQARALALQLLECLQTQGK